MRQLLIYTALLFWVACSGPKTLQDSDSTAALDAAADSVEYELVVFEPRFETWYRMQIGSYSDRPQGYYESWNRRYVNAWNSHSFSYGGYPLEPIVGYDPAADYGPEINRKLFYYFMYVEKMKGIRILPGGPASFLP